MKDRKNWTTICIIITTLTILLFIFGYLFRKDSLSVEAAPLSSSGIIHHSPMKRFSFQSDNRSGESKFRVFEGNELISYQHAIELLRSTTDFDFQNELSNVILSFAREQAVFWECVPINSETYSTQPFEFILLPAPALTHRKVDPKPFTQQFRRLMSSTDHYPVISFENLGRDAVLVVPGPAIDVHTNEHVVESYYTHLSSFLSTAFPPHRQKFWIVLGNTFHESIHRLQEQRNLRPIWLSTSGLGVSWLHVRIDTVPKYYNYEPYKQFIGTTSS